MRWEERRVEFCFCACARCRNCSPKQKCVMCNVPCETRCVRWERRFLISRRFSTRYSHLVGRFPMSTFLTSHLIRRRFLTSHLAFLLGTLFLTSHLTFHISVLGRRSSHISHFTSQLLGWRRVTFHISVYGRKNHPSLSQGVLAGLLGQFYCYSYCVTMRQFVCVCYMLYQGAYGFVYRFLISNSVLRVIAVLIGAIFVASHPFYATIPIHVC